MFSRLCTLWVNHICEGAKLDKCGWNYCKKRNIDGLVQERRNSIADAMELRLSCINPSVWYLRRTFLVLHMESSPQTLYAFSTSQETWSCLYTVYFTVLYLTHWGQDKMAAISKKTFPNACSSMKIVVVWFKFHLNKFPGIQWTMSQCIG